MQIKFVHAVLLLAAIEWNRKFSSLNNGEGSEHYFIDRSKGPNANACYCLFTGTSLNKINSERKMTSLFVGIRLVFTLFSLFFVSFVVLFAEIQLVTFFFQENLIGSSTSRFEMGRSPFENMHDKTHENNLKRS